MAYIIIALIIDIIAAFIMNNIALEKGYDDRIYFVLLCIFLGFVGWLIVIALPDRNARSQSSIIAQAPITAKQSTDFDASVLELKEIQHLYDAGVLSNEEFVNEKNKIMEVIEKNLEGND